MKTKKIEGASFWQEIRNEASNSPDGIAHFNDGSLQYVALFGKEMELVRRTREEFFSDTVKRQVLAKNLKVVINGNMWDATYPGMADAFNGYDPVPAADTMPLGIITSQYGKIVEGVPEPEKFFISYRGLAKPPSSFTSTMSIGFGNPPHEACGMGGLGPIIVGGIPYGVGNKYKPGVPKGAPASGEPGEKYSEFLIQRNNKTYASQTAFGAKSGKVILALSRVTDTLIAIVQSNVDEGGTSLDAIRDKLMSVGTDDAVFFDGSDSALLVINGTFHISQDETKDELTTIGLGFR